MKKLFIRLYHKIVAWVDGGMIIYKGSDRKRGIFFDFSDGGLF